MTQIPYKKMSGAGNDFIIIDARQNDPNLTKTQIATLSSRQNIGCDQFILIKNSKKSDCFMDIYNADGSKSSACGNATRCIASIIMDENKKDKITIETAADLLICYKNGDLITVEMTKPQFLGHFEHENFKFHLVDVGNPHAVCFADQIPEDETFFKIGQEVESHPHFPSKTNVEFAEIIDKNTIKIRVFERGAGETLACGTGACAVSAIAIKNNLTNSKITTKFKGGDLIIEWQTPTSPILMSGDHKLIETGTLPPC